ncbi:MAG: hypothetical protein QM718_05755 [Steroidobacteraceae bacterium]
MLPAQVPDGRNIHWWLLTPDEQIAATLRLLDAGMSDYDVAAATRLSVEQVRTAVGRRVDAARGLIT